MQSEQLMTAFTATVQASLHSLQALESALQDEQAAILGKDPQQLEDIVRHKLALLQQLEPSVRARDRLQATVDLPEGDDGGDRMVERLEQDRLRNDWDELKSLARRVAALNDHNGRLTLQSQRTTREALAILTGRPITDDTYSTLRRKAGGAKRVSLGQV